MLRAGVARNGRQMLMLSNEEERNPIMTTEDFFSFTICFHNSGIMHALLLTNCSGKL